MLALYLTFFLTGLIFSFYALSKHSPLQVPAWFARSGPSHQFLSASWIHRGCIPDRRISTLDACISHWDVCQWPLRDAHSITAVFMDKAWLNLMLTGVNAAVNFSSNEALFFRPPASPHSLCSHASFPPGSSDALLKHSCAGKLEPDWLKKKKKKTDCDKTISMGCCWGRTGFCQPLHGHHEVASTRCFPEHLEAWTTGKTFPQTTEGFFGL